jgi:hypothetical protein
MYIRIALIAVAMLSVLVIACKSSDQPVELDEPAVQVLKNATQEDASKINEPRAGTIVGGQTATVGLNAILPLPVMTLDYQNEVI